MIYVHNVCVIYILYIYMHIIYICIGIDHIHRTMRNFSRMTFFWEWESGTCFINEHAGTATVFFIRYGGQSFLSCFTIAFWSVHGDQTTKKNKCWLFEEDFPQHTLLATYYNSLFLPKYASKIHYAFGSSLIIPLWLGEATLSRLRSLLPRRARPCKSGSQWI